MTKEATHVRIPLSPVENLSIGALGGAIETTIQMPILTAKFCSQEGRKFPTKIAGWYRGVAVQAGTVAPITAIQFWVNGMILRNLALRGETREATSFEQLYSAAGAGAISALVYSPVDLITIQQQKIGLDPIRTAKTIVAQYGANAIFRGFVSCALRESIYTAGYLGFAPVITSHLSKSTGFFEDNPFVASVIGACVAGTGAALLTHPVDTCKTCVQSDMVGSKWMSARASFSQLIKHEGYGSLFRGFGFRTIRICGAFFVCMSLREVATDYKNKMIV